MSLLLRTVRVNCSHSYRNLKLKVLVNKKLLTGTLPVNKELLTGTVPVNKELLTGRVPVNNLFQKGILGSGHKNLLYGCVFYAGEEKLPVDY